MLKQILFQLRTFSCIDLLRISELFPIAILNSHEPLKVAAQFEKKIEFCLAILLEKARRIVLYICINTKVFLKIPMKTNE